MPAPHPISNTSTVTTTVADQDPTDNQATVTTPVNPIADLSDHEGRVRRV